jgi:hypothetical protein
VLLPLSILVSLFLMKDLKIIQLRKLGLTFLFGFIFCLPVLIWNYQNEWSSFMFQLNHGFNAPRFNASWPVTYIAGQILLFNPIIVYYILKNVKSSLSKNIALTQWGFFSLSSLKALVEANWPITSHAQGLAALDSGFKAYFKASVIYWVVIWFTLLGLLFTPFGQKKFNRLPQTVAAGEIYELTKDYRPLYGPTYQMSSLLQLISNEKILKVQHLSRFDLYDSIQKEEPKEATFYALKYTNTDWPEWFLKFKIESIKTIPKYELELFKVSRE